MRTKSAPSESVLPNPSQRPEFFRLPKPGSADQFFGLSRTFFYLLEKRGELKLVRLTAPGKRRGVTLIPFREVEAFVEKQRAQQEQGPAK
jgi:hypothetical protein